MYPIKQSANLDVVFFAFDQNGDGVTGKVDGDFSKRISKNGGAFSAMAVTVTERENGFYHCQISTSHSDTLGILTVSLSSSGIKRVNLQYRVHAKLPDDLASQASLDIVDDFVDTEIANIQSRLPATLTGGGNIRSEALVVSDKAGYALSTAGIQAIWDALTSALTVIGSIGKLLIDNINATISSRASQSSVDLVDDFVDTEVSAIKAVTDKLDTALEIDGPVYRYTANALEQAPTGGGASAAVIADAVWDEAISGHLTAGSTGAALNGAGSAGDPWTTPLPGAYGPGTAGKIVGDNLNATVSSRATQVSVDAVSGFVDTEVAAIKAKTDNLPTDPASASAISASFGITNGKIDVVDDFLDTEIAAIKAKTDNLPIDPADASDIAASFSLLTAKVDVIDDFLDTEVAAIKAKTDALPPDPADASDIAASFSTVNAKLDTIDDFLDTEVAAIKTKTDQLVFTIAGRVDASATMTISPGDLTSIADAILKRDFSLVSGESARSLLNAARFLRNKFVIAGTTLTVTKEDDATPAWTSILTTDAAAVPITGSDPA